MNDDEGKYSFDRSVEYFREHRAEFAREQYGKSVVIHDGKIHRFFDDIDEAYWEAKREFPPRTYMIGKCVPKEEDPDPVFHSRVS